MPTSSEAEIRKDEIERRLDGIFGRGSRHEIETATTKEKIVERIEEIAKRQAQFEKWEMMRGMPKEGRGQTEGSTSSGGRTRASPSSLKEKMIRLMPKRHWHSGETSATRKHVKGGEKICPSVRSSTG